MCVGVCTCVYIYIYTHTSHFVYIYTQIAFHLGFKITIKNTTHLYHKAYASYIPSAIKQWFINLLLL